MTIYHHQLVALCLLVILCCLLKAKPMDMDSYPIQHETNCRQCFKKVIETHPASHLSLVKILCQKNCLQYLKALIKAPPASPSSSVRIFRRPGSRTLYRILYYHPQYSKVVISKQVIKSPPKRSEITFKAMRMYSRPAVWNRIL